MNDELQRTQTWEIDELIDMLTTARDHGAETVMGQINMEVARGETHGFDVAPLGGYHDSNWDGVFRLVFEHVSNPVIS